MYNPFTLLGKKVLVTGASSGIGRSIAVICSKMGANLVLIGRKEEKLQETISLMEGKGHSYFIADLTNRSEIAELVNSFPQLDGIVHNAGLGSRVPCKQIHESDIDSVFNLNVKSPMLLQSEILRQKCLNKNSSIVFIASRAAAYPSIGNAVYSASKSAIISYSKVLALELSSRNIRVNSICPAMVWTDLITRQNGISVEDLEVSQLKYPLKRYGKPEDVAYLTVYLLSEASSWMTGSSLDITGGGEGLLI
ncbi:SDR family oxidoreductase [Bacteroides fragilis]|uniref:SDR family oxidoreductase n=1 Tax=Bacteroides fragilis TaxID=817 RepID=A0AAP8ZQM6_BACFG|nr:MULTISPECIES: SDR family oxidoreductase [Bacteroides]MBV4155845.1 SDR family oxidoreductase [Bacteroides fragilis]MCE8577529.1 SDR family oxidoreductase [Bacteroides fragilis]MCE8648354.1 SDR family oxidoreductase [Bacteroides fragilis]MCM0367369.1 SDR family oxidoreductase [Bacteroides fragilis]MCS2534612.1 SDR family oxidoreductase [Bacteroides fragilis]